MIWPFAKRKTEQVIGYCASCGGRLEVCHRLFARKKRFVQCSECHTGFDDSYSPSSVFVNIQSQRRSCRRSLIKFLLRDYQVTPRYLRSRYWVAYELPDGTRINYDSAAVRYDIEQEGRIVASTESAQDLIDWLSMEITNSRTEFSTEE